MRYTVSASPHVRAKDTVSSLMGDVIIALIPSLIAACVLYGIDALVLIFVCVVSCVAFEALFQKIAKKAITVSDFSAVITGLLLAFNLPSTLPLWMAIVGSFFAIVVCKQLFGGIGQNFINPAIGGRVFLLVSFSSAMTSWVEPLTYSEVDAVSTATPLSVLSSIDFSGDVSSQLDSLSLPTLWEMFLGLRGGCLGEGCALAILIGFVYLLCRRVIKPWITLSYVGTVAIFMLIASGGSLEFTAYELLSGGLLLGACFMATDYVTSPISLKGKIIFGIGCGLLTCVIRLFGSLPEGVSYSIMLMNILVPHIDTLTRPHPFGFVKEKKKKEDAA